MRVYATILLTKIVQINTIVSNDTVEGERLGEGNSRIETEEEISDYIERLKYAINHGASINFQQKRIVDIDRDIKYTNEYAIGLLFPDESPVTALKRELKTLTVQEYIETVKDLKFPHRDDMRVFGKTYRGNDDIYIKIRITMFDPVIGGNHTVFVMSFHYADKPFDKTAFPYRK